MKDNPWLSDNIQFPRLLSEIFAIIDFTNEQWIELCESMDLTEDEIRELFVRAEKKWEKIKAAVQDS